MLETVEIDEGIYDAENGINDLKIKNCPAMDAYSYKMALEAPMTKYELTDFNWTITSINDLEVENGKVVGIKVVDKLTEKLPGSGSKTTSLIGNIHIDVECNIDEYDIYKKYCQIYPNLTFTYGAFEGLDPAVEVKFMSNDSVDASIHYRVLASGEVNGDSLEVLVSAEGPTGLEMANPTKKDTSEHTYEFSGYWKNTANNKLYYRDGMENPNSDAINFNTIIPSIDMVFVPVFIEDLRKHEIKFHDYNGSVVELARVPYGMTYNQYKEQFKEGQMTNFYPMTDEIMLNKLPSDRRYDFKGWSTAKFDVDKGRNMEYFDLENEIVKRATNLYPYYETEDVREVASSSEYFVVSGNTINIKEEYRTTLKGKITLPNIEGVSVVGDFSYMPEITHVYFLRNSKNYTSYARNSFKGHKKLVKVDTPTSITTIGPYAFSSTSDDDGGQLVDVNLHNGITNIGEDAFSFCAKLEMNELPENLETLGANAFRNCKILEYFPKSLSLSKIGKGAFKGCTLLKKFYFNDKLTII